MVSRRSTTAFKRNYTFKRYHQANSSPDDNHFLYHTLPTPYLE